MTSVYLDPRNGNDGNDGLTAETPVLTLDRAKEIAGTAPVIVSGTIEVGNYETLVIEDVILQRAEGFTGYIVQVYMYGEVTIRNATIDGMGLEADKALVHTQGGTINIDQNAFLGAFALNFLEPIRFDRAFIGALGVDTGSGEVLTFELEDGLVKQLAIKNSTRSYLMVDSHKFGAPGSFAFAKIEDFDAVVTNEAPTEVDRFLRQHQVDRV